MIWNLLLMVSRIEPVTGPDLEPSIPAEIAYYTHGTVITQNHQWKYLLQTTTSESKIAIRHHHQKLLTLAAFFLHLSFPPLSSPPSSFSCFSLSLSLSFTLSCLFFLSFSLGAMLSQHEQITGSEPLRECRVQENSTLIVSLVRFSSPSPPLPSPLPPRPSFSSFSQEREKL